MKIWNAAPLVRLLLPFIAGIYTAIRIPKIHSSLLFLLFSFFIIVSIISFAIRINRFYSISWVYGIFIFILFFLSGYQIVILKTEQFSKTHFSGWLEKADYVRVRIASPCVEKKKSQKAIVDVIQVKTVNRTENVVGKAVIYFQKNNRSLQLANGDELIVKNKFREVEGPKNPEEFDYRQFLFYKGISHQCYLRTDEWIYTGENSGGWVMSHALRLRNKLLSIFSLAHLKEQEYAVAAALLIGYTDKLDADLLSAYSGTGVLHILSVSGMHVAIVFVFFNRILFFLDKFRYGNLVKAFLLIFFLWFYAFLSGLSPSVLRSSTMFSFIVCAKSFQRNSEIYNILAASALFLLLWNPYLIMDVGFQLSYLAVAGIVYFQPFFSGMITSENWFFCQLSDLLSVSVAAQLATMPLSLYYFHQFPNYFLFSNMLIIPLSTCIIYMGMLLILVSGNAFILKYVAIVFEKAMVLLNSSVVGISKLPYALTEGISVSGFEMYLLYGLIIFFHLFLIKKRAVSLKFALFIGIVLLVFQVMKQKESREQRKIIVYDVPGISAIDFIAGKQHVLMWNPYGKNNDSSWAQRLKPNWYKLGLSYPSIVSEQVKTPLRDIGEHTIEFCGKQLILLKNAQKTKQLYDQKKKLPLDYVIISQNVGLSVNEIREVYQPSCIVFDRSNSTLKLKTWEKECAQIRQSFYSILNSGAFQVAW